MRLSRFAFAGALIGALASLTVAAVPDTADAQSRSRSYSSPSRSYSSPSRSYSTPRPAPAPRRETPTVRPSEPRAIRAVPPPSAPRVAAPAASGAEPRVIRNVPPPTTRAAPTKTAATTPTREPRAINAANPTQRRTTVQRASRPPAYTTSSGVTRTFSPPPRHSRYRDTYYGSRPYTYGGSSYYPVYGSGPGMTDVLLWMVVADALSDNGERRINCENPATTNDARICADARQDAARQVGATQVAAQPNRGPNLWGWFFGLLIVAGGIAGAIWFWKRR